MAEMFEGVQAESPTATATETVETPGQAPSTPETLAPRTVPLDTFINERRSWQGRAQEAERRAQDFERQLNDIKRQQAAGQPVSLEQRVELERAGDALLNIVANHPKLKGLTNLLENADKLVSTSQSVEHLTTSQFNATMQAGDEKIAAFVKASGLPATPQFGEHFNLLVGSVIKAHPEATKRLMAGDVSVIDQACKYVADNFIGPVRQSATATVAQTKIDQKRLPPRSTGGAPGPSAPQPLSQDNEIDYRRGMHKRAMSAWEDATKG